MDILSTTSGSWRGYLSIPELEQYANITVTNDDEANDQISQAEEIIDAYAGFQDKYVRCTSEGKMSAVASKSQFTLDALYNTQFPYKNYFVGCVVELLSGVSAGQRRKITASNENGVITCDEFITIPGVGDFYKIYQPGKFPRCEDVSEYTQATPTEIYKSIPDQVKRAVAAQVEYMIEMGPSFFANDTAEKTAESIGNYSYQNARGQNGVIGMTKLIAPKAKALLRGIRCIVAEL